MQNPYETPNADLSTPQEQSTRLDIFKRFSTWYVFGLSIITLNLYTLYWLYSRTKTLNRLKDVSPIGDSFMFTVVVLNVVAVPLDFADLFFEDTRQLILFSNLFDMVGMIFILVWAFKFRHRLNDFLEKYQLPHSKAGPVFTFLFLVLHLSYKINQNLELLERATDAEEANAQESAEKSQLDPAEVSTSP